MTSRSRAGLPANRACRRSCSLRTRFPMSRHPAAAGFVCDEALASVADRVLGDHDPRVDRAVAAIPLRTHRARVPRVLPLPCGRVGFTFRTPMISNEVFVRNFRTPTRFLLTRPKTTIVSDLPLARSTPTRSRGRGLWMRTMREVPVIGFHAMYGSFVSMTGISFLASRRSLSFIIRRASFPRSSRSCSRR